MWLILLSGSAGMCFSGYKLQELVDQLNHDDRLDRMRMKRRGGRSLPSGVLTVEIRQEVQVQAAETGKWWSPTGAIVGGALATRLATQLQKIVDAVIDLIKSFFSH